jgi:ATP-binding cassette subfamily B protein
MRTLYRYLRPYWRFVLLALFLAAVNQVFSLLDPLIFRHVIDGYATQYDKYSRPQFFRGVALLLGMAVGVAFVSRVAKNFQDYFVNVVVQRVGADLYSDGIRHSLALPFQTFEDQRSGETLGKLQKVRSDTERFIAAFVNMVFTTLVGVIFVMVYAFKAHWAIAPAFLLTVPLLGVLSSVLSKRIKTIQKVIVAETTALAGATTESLRNIELVKSLGSRSRRSCGSTRRREDPQARAQEGALPAQPELHPGHAVNFLRTCILFLMLYLIFEKQITVGQFFSLLIYSFFIFGPLQELGTSSTSIARPKRRWPTSTRSSRSRSTPSRRARWRWAI